MNTTVSWSRGKKLILFPSKIFVCTSSSANFRRRTRRSDDIGKVGRGQRYLLFFRNFVSCARVVHFFYRSFSVAPTPNSLCPCGAASCTYCSIRVSMFTSGTVISKLFRYYVIQKNFPASSFFLTLKVFVQVFPLSLSVQNLFNRLEIICRFVLFFLYVANSFEMNKLVVQSYVDSTMLVLLCRTIC